MASMVFNRSNQRFERSKISDPLIKKKSRNRIQRPPPPSPKKYPDFFMIKLSNRDLRPGKMCLNVPESSGRCSWARGRS